jgi:hypothetical protein
MRHRRNRQNPRRQPLPSGAIQPMLVEKLQQEIIAKLDAAFQEAGFPLTAKDYLASLPPQLRERVFSTGRPRNLL